MFMRKTHLLFLFCHNLILISRQCWFHRVYEVCLSMSTLLDYIGELVLILLQRFGIPRLLLLGEFYYCLNCIASFILWIKYGRSYMARNLSSTGEYRFFSFFWNIFFIAFPKDPLAFTNISFVTFSSLMFIILSLLFSHFSYLSCQRT